MKSKKISNIVMLSFLLVQINQPIVANAQGNGLLNESTTDKTVSKYGSDNRTNTGKYSNMSQKDVNQPTKVVSGPTSIPAYLEADTVTFHNEFTGAKGDELHMGGQWNDKINLSTSFKPTSTLPDYHDSAITVDGVPGIWVPYGFELFINLNPDTFNGWTEVDWIDLTKSSFKITANGVDISSNFTWKFRSTGTNGIIGITMTYTPTDIGNQEKGKLAIGSGLDIELELDEPDVFPGNIGTGYFLFNNIELWQYTTPNGSPTTSNFGRATKSLKGLKGFWGYAPTMLGVDDIKIPLNSMFDPMKDVTAQDKHDGDLTSSVKYSGTVDTSKAGLYPIEYSVKDSDGQITQVERNVTVVEGKDITVEYKDSEGNKISENKVISGVGSVIGETKYDATTPEYKQDISGYILDTNQLPTNGIGVFTDQFQTVTYTYKKLGADVHVSYTDINNQPIPGIDEVILQGVVGEPYKTEQKEIPGYTFKEISGSITGYFTEKEQYVHYIYSKKQGGDITVRYEDEKGKIIHVPQVLKGNVGEKYDVGTAQYKLDINGYKYKEVQGNVTGTFTDQPQTVTYIYSDGVLRFENVPQTMSFEDSKISSKTSDVKRKEADWKIKVEDTRLNKTKWRVSAKLTSPLKDSTGEASKTSLLIYRDSNHSDQWIEDSEVDVFNGKSTDKEDYYDVSWSEQSGPLLSIAPGAVKADQYKGEIQWNLLDTPL